MSGPVGRNKLRALSLILITVCVAAASALFFLAYRCDNKYTAPGAQPVGGVLSLSRQDLQAHPVTFLVRDWELYRGRLLTPADFAEHPPIPDELAFIGQYGGFEGRDKNASPHGSATYRLRIRLPDEVRDYTLELPEIYSAYRLYINSRLVKQMGDPAYESYQAHTGNSTVTVQAAGSLELLFAVSDYGYLYSGLVYPPAFGEADAVAAMLNLRFALRMAVLSLALCVGLISLGIRLMSRASKDGETDYDLTLLYALLCFCFMGFVGYPVVKTLFPGGPGWYYFENFCYCALFLLVGLIQHRLSGRGGRAAACFFCLGAFVCCCSLLAPPFVPGNLTVLLAYSALLKMYTYAAVLFLTVNAAWSLYKRSVGSGLMAAGILVFDCALIFDRVFPDYEPILFGWFTELASAILVALVGVLMAGHVARQYRLRLVLEQQVSHASHMLELQEVYYPALLEKEQEARAARHDLRHHLLMLRELAAQGNLSALIGYLDEYDLTYLTPGETSYCNHYVVDMLLRLYAQRARQQHVQFTVNCSVPDELPVGNVDLCVIISNLLENALEACAPLSRVARMVHIGIIYKMSRLTITVDNSFDGLLQTEQGLFLSRKRSHALGVGLVSVKAVAERYCGNTHFYADAETQEFHSEVLLLARQGEASDATADV